MMTERVRCYRAETPDRVIAGRPARCQVFSRRRQMRPDQMAARDLGSTSAWAVGGHAATDMPSGRGREHLFKQGSVVRPLHHASPPILSISGTRWSTKPSSGHYGGRGRS
jgi:hypothetical protein